MPDQTVAPIDKARKLFRDVRGYPRVRKNPTLNGVGAGKTANCTLPYGETYNALDFLFTIVGAAATAAQIIAQVSNVKITVDGDPKIDLTGADLVALSRYYNTRSAIDPVQNGVVRLDFTRPWQRTIDGEDGAGWGTQDVATITLEVTLAVGATIDQVLTRRWVVDGSRLGRHLCIRRKPRPAPGITTLAAPERIDKWVNGLGTSLQCIHINTIDGTRLTDVRLEVDHIVELECEYKVLRQHYCEYMRAPQDVNFYQHIDFGARNRLQDGLPMIAQEMYMDLVWSIDPGAYVMLLEQIEGPVTSGSGG